jgi:bifunctional DNA-binding transcriptional regulator/antitoxin component of YhaV-PrlF toxin-antitoxin module
MLTQTVIVQEDPDTKELVLPLSDEILAELGWKIGDTLEWLDKKDGAWMIKKKYNPETEFVLVDCVSTFRQRYMVEVPKGKSEWALDTVILNGAKEFSQEHIGEQIISHRVVNKDEIIELCDKDNDYAKTWNDEHKFNTFVTSWKEE